MATRPVEVFAPPPLGARPALRLVEGGAAMGGGRYGADSKPNWPVIVTILVAHALMAIVLLTTGTIRLPASETPVFVRMIEDPAQPAPQQQADVPLEPVPVAIFVPEVSVETAVRPSPVSVTTVLPPPVAVAAPRAVEVSPAPPVAAPLTPPDFAADQLDNPGPRYPPMSRRNREQGTATLRVLVSPEGGASEIAVATSSGFRRLDDAALQTVRRWKFVPARQAGRPVQAWVLVPVTFSLDA